MMPHLSDCSPRFTTLEFISHDLSKEQKYSPPFSLSLSRHLHMSIHARHYTIYSLIFILGQFCILTAYVV